MEKYYCDDPVPHGNDSCDFANRYSLLRDDGHNRYYRENELTELFEAEQMFRESAFYTEVEIPRAMNEMYKKLLDNTPEGIKKEYRVKAGDEKAVITVKVINVLFRKGAAGSG